MIQKASSDHIIEIQKLFEVMTGERPSLDEVEYRFEHVEKSNEQDYFLYHSDEEVTGLMGFKWKNTDQETVVGEVSVLSVKNQYRGNGIGKSLLKYAEKLANDTQCEALQVVSGFGKATPAYRLYQSAGFKDKGGTLVKYAKDFHDN